MNRHLFIRALVAIFAASVTIAWAQVPEVEFARRAGPNSACGLALDFTTRNQPTEAQIARLTEYLERPGIYSFTSDWPGVESLVEIKGDNPPFSQAANSTPKVQQIPGSGPSQRRVCLQGTLPAVTRGEVHLAPPPPDLGWKLTVRGLEDLAVRYATGEDWEVPKFRAKVQVGTGTGGPALEFSGSGLLSNQDGRGGSGVWTLSAAGKVPLGTPKDVKSQPGADKDASAKIPDAFNADLNKVNYDPKRGLTRWGFRGRATGSFEGLELTSYYSPLSGFFDESHGFLGAEIEGGWRKGDAEFKTLTTKAPDRGSLVARLGGVIEWAPHISALGINRNLNRGLRFFVRGRAWLDTYNNDYGNRSVRLAPFLDSEIFYNFASDSRVFLRFEYGSLPPDLTQRVTRLFVGVGQAF
jgi:hypothetical protein